MRVPSRSHLVTSVTFLGRLLVLLVSILAFPTRAAAKCPDVPDDLVCPELRYAFFPDRPTAGAEITVTAYWIEERTGQPVMNVEWLARQGKPAYLWLWDHEPSELERIAFVEGMESHTEPPQLVVPLQWHADRRDYQGTFVFPESGRWYFMVGNVVPDALRPTLEADSNYVGAIQPVDVPAANGSVVGNGSGSVWAALMVGSALAISALLWLSRLSQRQRHNHPVL